MTNILRLRRRIADLERANQDLKIRVQEVVSWLEDIIA